MAKANEGGSSIGVEIVETKNQLNHALSKIANYCDELLIEEKITGREFSVGILGETVLPVIEIVPTSEFFDYQSKYQTNGTKEICPAVLSEELTAEMQEIAMNVHKRLGLSVYSRIDFIVDSVSKIYCIEANTLPGMTPNSLFPQEAKAFGMNYSDLCEQIIELSVKK